jgi:hypothetical protein
MRSSNMSAMQPLIVSAVLLCTCTAIGVARDSREGEQTSQPLLALLNDLRIPLESQVAVFSPTSLQGSLVSPENPRVIYFNDREAVAWVRGSTSFEVIDFSSANAPKFYTRDQSQTTEHRAERVNQCVTCHRSERTLGVPGLLTLSTPEAYGGGARHSSITTDHRTPLRERWGGWYVTGLSGGWRHRGNRVGQGWLESLWDQFDLTGYPTAYSDIVALMVLEHQARAVNLITLLADRARRADVSADAVRALAADLVDYFLFIDEAPLPARVISTSGFAQYFEDSGVRDTAGRSLREFDLKHRLFRYRCSYMIYSPTFNSLPESARHAVYGRLWQVLDAGDASEQYAQLSSDDRTAILDILLDTKADFREYLLASDRTLHDGGRRLRKSLRIDGRVGLHVSQLDH